MKIPLTPFSSEPREMNEHIIDLVSTSYKTADASPIILNRTESVLTKFSPIIVENDKEPKKAVEGKLTHERKRKTDEEFPTEKLSRKSIRVGEFMEIFLNTTETYSLYQGLKSLYELYEDIGQTPLGSTTYTKIDSSFKQFQSIIENDPSAARMLGNSENFELVRMLLQIITQSNSMDSLKKGLMELEEDSISSLTNAVSSERLDRILSILQDNLNNNNEEEWQHIFEDNQWILSQVFSTPYTVFEDKAYVGGKGISNKGGNICDFIYQNSLTQNIALIEIKTPCTPLFGSQYRNTYSLSIDMSGAINQVLNYRDNLSKEYYSTCHNSNIPFEVFSPKCFLIIGRVEPLNKAQIAAFENYRNSFPAVTIITFDELVQRVKDMIAIFNSDDVPEKITEEEDLPF